MLTETEQMRFRNALEAKRRELEDDVRSQAGQLAIADGVHDPMDQIQNMGYRDEVVEQVSRLGETLSYVEKSLRDLSDGCYGYCAECGEPITTKRLEIIPWATRCVSCQELREPGVPTDRHLPNQMPKSAEPGSGL